MKNPIPSMIHHELLRRPPSRDVALDAPAAMFLCGAFGKDAPQAGRVIMSRVVTDDGAPYATMSVIPAEDPEAAPVVLVCVALDDWHKAMDERFNALGIGR